MLSSDKIKDLKIFATKIRIEAIKAIGNLGFGHVGGVLSIADTLAVLYGEVMNIDPKNPRWEDRDWLICSKGHAGPAVYAALALKGYFPLEDLMTLNKPGTNLPSHCDRNLTTGIDMTTGSLGQGASIAVGVALGNRLNGRKNFTYLILGDGEIQEGQIWEAALYAAQQKLDNLIAFVDYNKKQLDGYVKDINDLGNIKLKFESFGWFAQEVNGAEVEEIYDAIQRAKQIEGKPSVIVLNTIKGKGWSYAEKAESNHHMIISQEQLNEALEELQTELKRVVAK
ncbi:transketolase [Caloramator sp. CAR-1]|uniref:transketolase n=1 Tax=Caloramator sp. CAR-1 TaxID=3062777 RepID=UPI0026E11B96|nr:transketolase [Caloramator sp. CAR-1]MDO6355660.1 transketolase [Caloramator sp. CAR-1]